jgi:hypothetical protein
MQCEWQSRATEQAEEIKTNWSNIYWELFAKDIADSDLS